MTSFPLFGLCGLTLTLPQRQSTTKLRLLAALYKIMTLPNRKRNWLKEVKSAYAKAEKIAQRENIELGKIYLLAGRLVAKNRSLKSESVIKAITDWIEADVAYGESVDPGSKNRYLFHFASAYVHGHHVAGLLGEMECDRILEYINGEWDLFPGEK